MKRSFRAPAKAERYGLCPDAPRLRTGEGNRRHQGSPRKPVTVRDVCGGKEEAQRSKAAFCLFGQNKAGGFAADDGNGRAVI